MKRRVDEAVLELALSGSPSELGVPKKGKFKGLYSYEVGRRVRIIYTVDVKAKAIYLLRVGPHEEAYR